MTTVTSSYDGFDGQFIGGRWTAGRLGRAATIRNPYTRETVAEIQLANSDDVDAAFRAAKAAQAAWAKTGPTERIDMFRRVLAIVEARRDEIVGWIIRESGSTFMKAQAEWMAVRGGLIEALTLPPRVEGRIMPIDAADKDSFVFREPLGVVGVISPWNFPMHLSHRTIAPALAVGNAVVVKPALETPITGGLLLAKIYEEAGLPEGLLNVVVGDVPDIADTFVLHPLVNLLSFTGSTPTGRRVAQMATAAPQIKHVGLELGGNAPLIVLADADLEKAASAAVFARFLHSGQICMSANRLIVEAPIYDDFVDLFVAKTKKLKVGDPSDPQTLIGPLISERQRDAALQRITEGRSAGFAERLKGEIDGLVVPPHVFSEVDNESAFAQAEQFAPIASIIRAEDEYDAVRLANATQYGLASSVFTGDVWRGLRIARHIEAGMTHVNDIPIQDSPFNMFGGEKNSGLGRFNGGWGIEELTRDHWVTCRTTPPSFPV
ncbi:aldehyde dehydrogenase family protein [Novosphingobium sp. RL4]|uniref:aldehyde dehydrogenase family protein n=1 Tax=Novosphingobium sp. RL4 TaxID=3109595 RepID=UPI002D77233E|nr:aldehyde dehydrogenase family protein [Novosphingobium sp. RL4]WRT94443.1 aldehyde dehydrogenase family protein [Novosphingobium sp. RL4]